MLGQSILRCAGRGPGVGLVNDGTGNIIGPYVTKPDKRYGDAILTRYPTLIEDYNKAGKGPIYMDCADLSDEDNQYMLHFLYHEGNAALVNHLMEEGIDPRMSPVEIMRYEMKTIDGVHYNEKGETSLRG